MYYHLTELPLLTYYADVVALVIAYRSGGFSVLVRACKIIVHQ